jgi:hypothetical protein
MELNREANDEHLKTLEKAVKNKFKMALDRDDR